MGRSLCIGLGLLAFCTIGCASSPESTRASGYGKAKIPKARSFRGFNARPSAVRTSRVEARLIRRDGGEWVIVHLTESPPGESSPRPSEQTGPPQDELRQTLRAYERAFERGDRAGLAQVWAMNPTERSTVERMFRSRDRLSVTLSEPAIEVSGDRARLEFDQRFAFGAGPGASSRLERLYWRALAASDTVGVWSLDSLTAP